MTTTDGSFTRTALNATRLSGVALVFSSLMLSLFAAATLPGDIRIRWHVGTYEHWGPATASSKIVTVAIPGALLLAYIVLRLSSRYVRSDEGRFIFDLVVVFSMAAIVFVQVLLIGLNLVITA